MGIHAFKELKTYIALNAGAFLKPLQFFSCGSLLWNYKITDFLTQTAKLKMCNHWRCCVPCSCNLQMLKDLKKSSLSFVFRLS